MSDELVKKHNHIVGQLAVIQLAFLALAQQAPNPRKLAADFAESTEDHAMRALFSNRPDSFHEGVEETRAALQGLLDELTQQ